MCPVGLGALRPGLDAAPSPQRLGPAEDRAGAVADVLAVLPVVPPRPGRDRLTDVAEQLVWLLIPAHPPTRPGVGAGGEPGDNPHPRPRTPRPPWGGGSATSLGGAEVWFFIHPP